MLNTFNTFSLKISHFNWKLVHITRIIQLILFTHNTSSLSKLTFRRSRCIIPWSCWISIHYAPKIISCLSKFINRVLIWTSDKRYVVCIFRPIIIAHQIINGSIDLIIMRMIFFIFMILLETFNIIIIRIIT